MKRHDGLQENQFDPRHDDYMRIDDATTTYEKTHHFLAQHSQADVSCPALKQIVEHSYFKNGILACIIINAVMMGIETTDLVEDNPSIKHAFQGIDTMFLLIFTGELVLQFLYRGFAMFYKGWIVFDFGIIVLSWTFYQLSVIRAFRIFRAVRVISRVESLRIVVLALLQVIPRMLAIFAFLLLIMYIFAVLFTTLFRTAYEDGYTDADYFSRLDYTFFTLLQMTTMDGWGSISREVMVMYGWVSIALLIDKANEM